MKALFITLACLVLAFILRVTDMLMNRSRIKSVGAKANSRSKDIATIDLSSQSGLEAGLEHYKDLMD